MYNLVLIDDEPNIVQGLCTMIDWKKYGLHVVATFCDVESALAYLRSHPVHLVIADIRMPGRGGLGLIEQIRLFKLPIEVILMSGYQDFNYVKQAMMLGVQEYILKPVFEEDIGDILIRICALISAQEKLRQKTLISKEEQIKLYLLDGIKLNEDLHQDMNEAFLRERWIYMQLVTSGYSEEYSLQAMLKRIESCVEDTILVEINSTDFGLLIRTSLDCCDLSEMESSLMDFLAEVKIKGHFYVTERLDSLEHLREKFQYIEYIDRHLLREGQRKWIKTWDSYDFSEKNFDYLHELEEIINIIERGSQQELSDSIVVLFNNLEAGRVTFDKSREIVIDIFQKAYQRINKLASSYDNPIESHELPSFDDLTHMEACYHFIQKQTQKLLRISAGLQKQFRQSSLNQVDLYLNQHLTEPITLKQLATEFYVHPNYLGQKMKEEWGETFLVYFNRKRIERAVEYMAQNLFTIEEIAEKVGYTNYNQFLKWFKRIMNQLPKDYRQQQN